MLYLRLQVPHLIVKTLSDFVFKLGDICNGECVDIHETQLNFYFDASLDENDFYF